MTGPQLTAIRKRMGLSQVKLAKKLRYSVGHVSRMENGAKPVTNRCAVTVRMLAAANGKAMRDRR